MRIEHVALYTSDLEKAKEFFVKYFHASVNDLYHNTKTNFKSYFLSFDQGARLEIMNKPSVIDKTTNAECMGYAHVAFSVGSKEKVDSMTIQLKNDGYLVTSGPRITGDGYYESCVQIFDGIVLEITM